MQHSKFSVGCVVAIFTALLIGGCGTWIASNNNISTITVEVTDKESVNSGKSHEYRIYTNQGTFVNADSLYHGKWNSADIQGKIVAGRTYRIKVCGWRFGFLSWFRNILTVTEIKTENESEDIGHEQEE